MENQVNLADSWRLELKGVTGDSPDYEAISKWSTKFSLDAFEFACACNNLDPSCALRYFTTLLCSPMWRWVKGEIAAMHWLEEKYDQPFMRTQFVLTGDFMSFDANLLVEVATQRSKIAKTGASKFGSFCRRSSNYGFKDKLLLRVDPDTLEIVDQIHESPFSNSSSP